MVSNEGPLRGSRKLFVELVHMFEEAIHERSRYYQVRFLRRDGRHQVADYLELISRMHQLDPELRASELYVCTAPLMWPGMPCRGDWLRCSLLRAVVEKPLLAYLGMQLHVLVDRQIDQLWLMHFQAMARDERSNVWAVHNFAMREQIRCGEVGHLVTAGGTPQGSTWRWCAPGRSMRSAEHQ